jgi:hypothetical protein
VLQQILPTPQPAACGLLTAPRSSAVSTNIQLMAQTCLCCNMQSGGCKGCLLGRSPPQLDSCRHEHAAYEAPQTAHLITAFESHPSPFAMPTTW